MSSVFTRLAIIGLVVLVLSVVILQYYSTDTTQPSSAPETASSTAASKIANSCGDGVCNNGEYCSICPEDCTQCEQTYCCNTSTKSCDGPFNVSAGSETTCNVVGYDAKLYLFSAKDGVQREAAFETCNRVCGVL